MVSDIVKLQKLISFTGEFLTRCLDLRNLMGLADDIRISSNIAAFSEKNLLNNPDSDALTIEINSKNNVGFNVYFRYYSEEACLVNVTISGLDNLGHGPHTFFLRYGLPADDDIYQHQYTGINTLFSKILRHLYTGVFDKRNMAQFTAAVTPDSIPDVTLSAVIQPAKLLKEEKSWFFDKRGAK